VDKLALARVAKLPVTGMKFRGDDNAFHASCLTT
jgi:hypothetical protein